MERAALLRSLSSSRCFCRSSPSLLLFSRSSCLSSSAPFHYRRSISYPTGRSVLRRHFRLVPAALPSLSLNLRKHFSSVSPRAVASPPFPSTPEFAEVKDEVAEKLGFEKVSEEFIPECKSKAVLFRHKKTSAEVMSVSNDDENKVFGIVFRTPP